MTDSTPTPRRILVTGADGHIGSYFITHVPREYALRLLIQPGHQPPELAGTTSITGDLSDLEGLKEACAGIETVVHLAATPDPSAVWSDLLRDNIIGTYHLFTAARAAGCRRVIFASSIHAVSGYPADVQVKPAEAVNPGDLYGVSKCFGEALGRYMAEQEGLSTICIRIGAFQSRAKAQHGEALPTLDAYVSPRDLQQLICRCIEYRAPGFLLVHGLSNNRFKRLDISNGREVLGYEPIDDITAIDPLTKDLQLGEVLRGHNVQDHAQQSGLREDL
jgi:NAD dependent epimerase/dehydratase family